MFKSLALEPHNPFLSLLLSRKALRQLMLLMCVIVLAFQTLATAQSSNTSGIEAYAAAIKQSNIGDRIAAMEHFLTIADSGSLRLDALEVLSWDYRQMGNPSRSNSTAEELLKVDQSNPIALAILSEDQRKTALASQNVSEEQYNMATRGLSGLARLRKPEGMLTANFSLMQRQITGMLNGIAGLGYLDHSDYGNARDHLKNAVNVEPNNSRYIYGLALALLLAKNPDEQNGYWYLARAVNLTQGTPSGVQVAQYARSRYRSAGGSDANWNQYLTATAVPRSSQPAAVQAANAPAPAPPATASNSSAAAASSPTTSPATSPATSASAPSSPATPSPSMSASKPSSAPSPASSPAPSAAASPSASVAATAAPPATQNTQVAVATAPPSPAAATTTTASKSTPVNIGPPPLAGARVSDHPEWNPPPQPAAARPAPRKVAGISAPNAPISLGILLQTSLLSGGNRPEIIAALTEMVQRLRPEDEAFIMAFSSQLDFEQDLTANDQLLLDAMAELKPKAGAALLEGVEFAAGHLKRIGKNPNRVLLIISDGRNSSNKAGSTLSAQLKDVRVDCIGIDVGGEAERALLQRLAASSGGHASFTDNPQQFRAAASQMTQLLGIENH